MTEGAQERLTARQLDVLQEVSRLEELGQPVTTARLGEQLGMPRQNVRTYLLGLRDRGLVVYEAGERQTAVIRLTEEGRSLTRGEGEENDFLSFPILGEVAAGQPTLADSRIEGYATRLSDVLDLREGDFLLRVRGDSMIRIGIYPGDLVAIHPVEDEPHNGEVVLVAVPNEETATLKRWRRNNGTVTLISENPAYDAMTYPVEAVRVQGCMVGHIGTGRTRRTHPPQEP